MRLMEKKRIMKKLFILAFLLFATHSNVPAQLSKQEMRNDLEVFATTLPQKHLNLFAKLDKKDFEKKISTLNARIDSLDEESFFIELFQIIKAVGDEHTRLFPNQSNYQLPIVFSVFKEGCFVTESTRPELLYGKLTAINGISMKEILRRYKKIINDENPSYFNISLPRYLNNTFILKGLGITSTKDSVVCSFSDGKGDTIVTTLKPDPKAKRIKAPAYSQLEAFKNAGIYGQHYDAAHNSLYVYYHSCRNDKERPFGTFMQELFDTIARRSPQKLIIDLRYNGGGNSSILDPLIDSLQNNYLAREQSLYVLIGKQTFSSALLNAMSLKKKCHAILVGEPTAGTVNHYGETRTFKLPCSHATVTYSTKYFETWKGHDGALHPDKAIAASAEDFKRGHDTVLEYIYPL